MDDDLTRGFPAGDIRASHDDRDRAVAELSAAYQAGRLDIDEFNERSSRALSARTGAELTALFVDLPLTRPARRAEPAVPAAALVQPREPVGRGIVRAGAMTGGFVFTFASLVSALTASAAVVSQSAVPGPNGVPVPGSTIMIQQGSPDYFSAVVYAIFAFILFSVAIRMRRNRPARPAATDDSPA